MKAAPSTNRATSSTSSPSNDDFPGQPHERYTGDRGGTPRDHAGCLTCYDLHRADWDHAWRALLPQLGRHTGILTPAALDAVTVHAAALELPIEVLAHCDGRPTRTIGQFLAVGPGHDERNTWPLAFHHSCTCDILSAA